ncbi:MAG TPA: tetratricopeptide repeat protein [Gemmataceae bacterium]|nr:tetratricopeptide repeat protein [Gemmataceae bacterium]
MSNSLLLEYYQQIPEGRSDAKPKVTRKEAIEVFKHRIAERYSEGTLLRLLENGDNLSRRAALLALGLLGTMNACAGIAARLHDEDRETTQIAADTLWTLWFRGDTPANNQELQRLARQRDRERALAGMDALIKRAPEFAEAYNQRAIIYFRLKKFDRSIADCEKTLKLNPYHFGAQAGLGQCYMQMRKHRAALKAFRAALRLNPHMDGVAETIRALENALGEEGRRDDKK